MLNNRMRYISALFLVASLLIVAFITLILTGTHAYTLSTTQFPQIISSQTIRSQRTITYQINDIVGAAYDPSTKDLIIIGQMLDQDLPVMDYDYVQEHLLASLRAVHETTHPSRLGDPLGPAVTIDPVSNDFTADHKVKFFGNITNTHYGYVFFEADRLLKTYTLGKDNLNPEQPFISSVPGYSSYFDRLVSLNPGNIGNTRVRWWFTPLLSLRISPVTSQTIVFSNTKVILNRELTGNGITSKEIKAANDFVAHFNQNYSLFAAEQHKQGNATLYELPQLYKLYGVAYWTWAESNAAINLSGVNQGWLNHSPIINFTTPNTTPVISRSSESIGLIIYGGVGTNPPENIVPDPYAAELGPQLLADRPSLDTMAWVTDHCQPGHNPTTRSRNSTCVVMAFRLSTNLITDGSFENTLGSTWMQGSSGNFGLITNDLPHWGNYGAFLGGYSAADDIIWQQVTVPSDATDPRLSYYWLMDSGEPSLAGATINSSLNLPPSYLLPTTSIVTSLVSFDSPRSVGTPLTSTQFLLGSSTAAARDFLYVEIRDVNNNPMETLHAISNNGIRQLWQVDSFSLKAYLGQTIRVMFRSTNDDNGLDTSFLVDDVSLDIIAAPSTSTHTPTPTITPTNMSTPTATPTPTSTSTGTVPVTITPTVELTPKPDTSNNTQVFLPLITKK